ncbi:MAG TPA: DUF58 domain-containing protein [Chryseosolibacter sp.]|nr:DUF58 domain-containing protein [Chryseosolibacter sp.]
MSIKLSEIAQNASLELLARQLVEGFITGLHKSPYHGFSVEFAEHRLYNEGESTKHIDWKVYARTDRLFTKRYEEETNLRCLIAVDTSKSMYYPGGKEKIRFSVYAASALAYLLQKQRDAVGLCLFSDQIELMTPVKSSPTHLQKVFSILETVKDREAVAKNTHVTTVLHEIAEKIHKRSLVMIFSDMFEGEETDDLFKALQHLKHNKHEVIVFHVMDNSTELEFEFEDRPMEFIDLESGQKIKLNPGDVKKHYRASAERFHSALKMKCNQFKIDFIEADVKSDFNHILQSYLIKRARMR